MRHARRLLTRLAVGTLALSAIAAAVLWLSADRYRGEPAPEGPLVLVRTRLYDPAGDSTVDDATVVIEGRRITAAGSQVAVPDGARVLDLRGLTLLPGLIDSHVHLGAVSDGPSHGIHGLGYLWQFVQRFPQRRRALIEAGVTTVKSVGDPTPWIFDLSDAIRRHDLGGPRIFAGSPILTAPGGQPVARLRSAGQGDTSYIVQVALQLADTAGARRAVESIPLRARFVTAVLDAGPAGRLPALAPPVLATIVRTARARGLPAVVQVGSIADIEAAVAAGATGIEGLAVERPIGWDTALRMRGSHVFVDPTLTRIDRLEPPSTDGTRRVSQGRRNLERLYRAGVPIVAGSDAPYTGPFGSSLHEELRSLVDAGMSPRDALAAATSVAARALRLDDRLGGIEPGKLADLIAVYGDPLSDIDALTDIVLVIADGRMELNRLARIPRPGAVLAGATPGKGRP